MLFLSEFYQNIFGTKTYKLSLDAGCTCPNRDGSKGTGGCIFCSQRGSGDFTPDKNLSIKEQVFQAKKKVESKLKGRSGTRTGKYIAYFQNFSSTYGPPLELAEKYREALACPDVAGLAVATRPDCLSCEILSELSKIAQTHFVQIELGLQTSNEKTGLFINRLYTNTDYIDAVKRIKSAGPKIHIVTHLIFGLPSETEGDMLESVKFVIRENSATTVKESVASSQYVTVPDIATAPALDTAAQAVRDTAPLPCATDFFGIKITSLYVLKNTPLADLYTRGKYVPLQKEEYFLLLKKALALLPENCVVHRLTGDPPKALLLAPAWPTDKKRVLNELSHLFL